MSKFDQPVSRVGTSSAKWEKYANSYYQDKDEGSGQGDQGKDIIPMWVADTDFKTCSAITDALQERIEHGVFGYTLQPMPEFADAIAAHLKTCYDWSIEKEWIVLLPSLITGLNLSCQVVKRYVKDSAEASDIMIPSVIYPPFKTAPIHAQQQVIHVPLILKDERWVIDIESLQKLVTKQTRMLLFCNPQNPGGSVYTENELMRIHQFCEQHDLLICSDEIHCDLVLDEDKQHIPIASLNDDVASRTITLMAASKTFNVAGLSCGFAIISNEKLRMRFKAASHGLVPEVNVLGQVASTAAFNHGQDWMREQNDYLKANRDYLMQEINAISGLSMVSPEATFLAWIDISALKLENPSEFFEKAGVGLSEGDFFGDERFMRLNFGCSRKVLEEAVQRISVAVRKYLE